MPPFLSFHFLSSGYSPFFAPPCKLSSLSLILTYYSIQISLPFFFLLYTTPLHPPTPPVFASFLFSLLHTNTATPLCLPSLFFTCPSFLLQRTVLLLQTRAGLYPAVGGGDCCLRERRGWHQYCPQHWSHPPHQDEAKCLWGPDCPPRERQMVAQGVFVPTCRFSLYVFHSCICK